MPSAPKGEAGPAAHASVTPSVAAPTASVDLAAVTRTARGPVFAFGDVHGDLEAARRALRLAGVVDAEGRWTGGENTVVQVGDQTDRGDDERAILDWFDRLRDEAEARGGLFVALSGNHEVMNVAGDFRYVNDAGFTAFEDFAKDAQPSGLAPHQRGRATAFAPGGAYARKLAEQPLVLVIEDTLFVHGGVLMKHVTEGLPKLDAETRAWMRGERPAPPAGVTSEDGLVWARHYSAQPSARECEELSRVLAATGTKRMVMGHTVQRGDANAACGGKAWRIDTGMSRAYQGEVQVLRIERGEVRVLKER
jgi:hypothetical protein